MDTLLGMAKKPHGGSGQKGGRPKTPHERSHFSIRIRKELIDLIELEMEKQRPFPDRNKMVEVIIEDGLLARGYRDRMPWLDRSMLADRGDTRAG